MRTLGLLGGMAWPSTMDAYRRINEGVHRRLGGHHSAPLLIRSFDFAEIAELQERDDWAAAGALLAGAAATLESAGAEGLLLCTNTMHRVADVVEEAVSIPLLHIADATAARIRADGGARVGLLGTRFTMEQPFYVDRLRAAGIEVLVPDPARRAEVHRVIYDELVHGRIEATSRELYRETIGELTASGAEGIIAGCTEIELLITDADVPGPYYPTTAIHTDAAVAWIVGT